MPSERSVSPTPTQLCTPFAARAPTKGQSTPSQSENAGDSQLPNKMSPETSPPSWVKRLTSQYRRINNGRLECIKMVLRRCSSAQLKPKMPRISNSAPKLPHSRLLLHKNRSRKSHPKRTNHAYWPLIPLSSDQDF